MIAAAQDQFRQNQPFGYRQEGGPIGAADPREDSFDDEEESSGQPIMGGGEQPSFGTRDPQPYLPRDAQFFSPRDQQQFGGRPQHGGQRGERGDSDGNVDRLPSFITGGGPQPAQQSGPPPQQGHHSHQNHGSNGYENQGGGDRFPLHRRRRRHRGPRPDSQSSHQDDGE
jgi:hypothetical protein